MCKVMGIVNVTPDSFSDGGKFFKPEEAIRRAKNLIADGAEMIDIGAESTRPGAEPITWEEEWSRLEPVLQGLSPILRGQSPTPEGQSPTPEGQSPTPEGQSPLLSIDTYHPETAERAIELGADVINCVYVGTVPQMMEICAQKRKKIVIPYRAHWGQSPDKSWGQSPDKSAEGQSLGGGGQSPGYTLADFEKLGLDPILDPMIGFGTTREEDIELLRSIPDLRKLGPVMIGASRKRIVKKLVGVKAGGKDIAGNLAIAVWAAMNGADWVRVHDVAETVRALKVIECLKIEN